MNKLLLTTPTDPKMLSKVLNENSEVITKATLISVDFPPIEVFNGSTPEDKRTKKRFFNKNQNQAMMFDVVGIIIDISSINGNETMDISSTREHSVGKKVYLMANEVMFISNQGSDEKLISINGNFDILPDQVISRVYSNFSKLKSVDLNELEDMLELSRDETAVKAFNKLGSFFTAQKYEINNNIFNLIKHQEEAELVSKKVLLRKIVAWEIRK